MLMRLATTRINTTSYQPIPEPKHADGAQWDDNAKAASTAAVRS